jgi:hypothetical protein
LYLAFSHLDPGQRRTTSPHPPPEGDNYLSTPRQRGTGTPPTETVGISEIIIKLVIPAQAGIQNLLKILDSPVSSTGQAQSRASLVRNDKKENYDTVSLKRGTLGGENQ